MTIFADMRRATLALSMALLAIALLAVSACQSADSPEKKLAAMIVKVDNTFPGVEQISTEELAQWLGDTTRPQPQLLDVREAAEYAVSHLPGAIRLDPNAEKEQLEALIDRTRPVVLYCSVGYRSSAMAEKIESALTIKALNLRGSIFQWANEQRPLQRSEQATQQVHPYDNHYGGMVEPAYRSEL